MLTGCKGTPKNNISKEPRAGSSPTDCTQGWMDEEKKSPALLSGLESSQGPQQTYATSQGKNKGGKLDATLLPYFGIWLGFSTGDSASQRCMRTNESNTYVSAS